MFGCQDSIRCMVYVWAQASRYLLPRRSNEFLIPPKRVKTPLATVRGHALWTDLGCAEVGQRGISGLGCCCDAYIRAERVISNSRKMKSVPKKCTDAHRSLKTGRANYFRFLKDGCMYSRLKKKARTSSW